MVKNECFADIDRIANEIKQGSHFHGSQRAALYGLALFKTHHAKSAIYLDVGTWMGSSAVILASVLKHQNLKIPHKVYTVDNYAQAESTGRGYDKESDKEVYIKAAKESMSRFGVDEILSIYVMDDIEFVNSLPDNSIDMVFDDSDHSYISTLNRLRSYVPKLRENSLIVGHDYFTDMPQIIKAVDDFRKEYSELLTSLMLTDGLFWMFCKVTKDGTY